MLVPIGAPPEAMPDDGSGATSGPFIPQCKVGAASGIASGPEPSPVAGASIASLGPGRCGLCGLPPLSSPQPPSAIANAHIHRPQNAAMGCTDCVIQPPSRKKPKVPSKLNRSALQLTRMPQELQAPGKL